MSEEDRDIFNRISERYYDLTEAERKAADYVAVHQWEVQLMSISELAESCGVAEATITRFCRRLGYKGYSAFKLALAHASARPVREQILLEQIRPDDSIPVLAEKICAADKESLDQTLAMLRPELLSRAADMLCSAERVLCLGQGGSAILAQEAAHLFSTALPGYYVLMDAHLQSIAMTHLTPSDVVMFISYSGSTRDAVELLPIARERGARVILFTRFPKSPAAAYADVVLQCGSNEMPFQLGSIPARMGQLFMVDLLFNEVCRRNQEKCSKGKEQVAEVLSGRHL